MSRPARDRTGLGGAEVAAWAVLLGTCALLIWLGTGPLWLGPNTWDDAMYTERAATGSLHWEVRNRCVHIWGIRIFHLLIEPLAVAAGAWATAMAIGLSIGGFLAGRILGGPASAAVAALAVPFFPSVLQYISVPHVDLPMACFSLLAIVAAVDAGQAQEARRATVSAALAGLCLYLALESKETALAAVPAVGLALAHRRPIGPTVWLAALGGMAVGLLTLRALDLAFVAKPDFLPSDPLHYFQLRPPGAAATGAHSKPAPLKRDLARQLSELPFLATMLLGLGGAARAFRAHLMARALTVWVMAVLTLTAAIAAGSRTIQANHRYVLAVGVGLAPLAAFFVVDHFRRERRFQGRDLLWLGVCAVPLLKLAPTLWTQLAGEPGDSEARAVYFLGPVVLLSLFLTPFATVGRWTAGPALALALTLGMQQSWEFARAEVVEQRERLAPWRKLAAALDAADAPISVTSARRWARVRVRRHLRALSSRPARQVRVDKVAREANLPPGEWVFTGGKRNPALEKAGYVPVARYEHRRLGWVAYRPPD
ncbi:MAG: hypothetical protein PVI30_07220 [Myxococcales bacterium]|jgi:hypothetical protein